MILSSSAASPLSALEAEEFLRQYQERFLTVLCTFRPHVRPQVKAIWAFMLQNGSGKDDRVLAEAIKRETGHAPPLGAIAAKRFHLRQRLEVFRFFDEHRPGQPDLPGDASVFQWVRERRGLFDEDEPTLRKLVGGARAARGEKTLGWALLARACVDTEQDRPAFFEIAQALIRQARWDSADAARRFKTYQAWVGDRALRKKVSNLRNLTKSTKSAFLFPSCWYLTLLREKGEAEINAILRPSPAEEERVKEILGGLR
jgi:hypothetical protein